jgi:hypothetical protein
MTLLTGPFRGGSPASPIRFGHLGSALAAPLGSLGSETECRL